jgi:hypothetical protein
MRAPLIAALLTAAFAVTAPAAPPIHVMLLDGQQAGAYHAWQETTPYLRRMLEDTGLFQVDVVTAPPRGDDFSGFKPDWSKYQVVVVGNYDALGDRWPDSIKASFAEYIRNGGDSFRCMPPTMHSRTGGSTTS